MGPSVLTDDRVIYCHSKLSKQKQVDDFVFQLCSACAGTVAHTLTSSPFICLRKFTIWPGKNNSDRGEIKQKNAFKTMLFDSSGTIYRILLCLPLSVRLLDHCQYVAYATPHTNTQLHSAVVWLLVLHIHCRLSLLQIHASSII